MDVEDRSCRSLDIPPSQDSPVINVENSLSLLTNDLLFQSAETGEMFRLPPLPAGPRSMPVFPVGCSIYPPTSDSLIPYSLPGEIGVINLETEEIFWRTTSLPSEFPVLSMKSYAGATSTSVFFCLGSQLLGLSLEDGSVVRPHPRAKEACGKDTLTLVLNDTISVLRSDSIFVLSPQAEAVTLVDPPGQAIAYWPSGNTTSFLYEPDRIFRTSLQPTESSPESGGSKLNYRAAVIGFSIMAIAIALLVFGLILVCFRQRRKRKRNREAVVKMKPLDSVLGIQPTVEPRKSMAMERGIWETGTENASVTWDVVESSGVGVESVHSWTCGDIAPDSRLEKRATVLMLPSSSGDADVKHDGNQELESEVRDKIEVGKPSMESESSQSYHSAKSNFASSGKSPSAQYDEEGNETESLASFESVKSTSTIKDKNIKF